MPENNENKNLEQQRQKFLKDFEEKEKLLDAQLNNKPFDTPTLPKIKPKTETVEEQRERFLKELDQKERDLNRTIEYENSLAGSNLSRRKKMQAQEKMKFNFYKTIISSVVLIIVVVVLCSMFVSNSYEEQKTSTTTHNTNQVKFALINYYNDNKKLPIDGNSKIDTTALIKGDYLHTDVESQCNCSFYLKDDKQTVLAIPKSNSKK